MTIHDFGYAKKLIADEGKQMARIVDGRTLQQADEIIIRRNDPFEHEWVEVEKPVEIVPEESPEETELAELESET